MKGEEMEKITENSGIHQGWYVEAKQQTLETLPGFLRKLAEDYEHDYGTICHAVAAAALGAAWAVDRSPQGGITGFQGGAIMWEFIKHWKSLEEKPLRLLDYSLMLYPQFRERFTTISPETWEYLQEQAQKFLAEKDKEYTHPDVRKHWSDIAKGQVPFGLTVAKKE